MSGFEVLKMKASEAPFLNQILYSQASFELVWLYKTFDYTF